MNSLAKVPIPKRIAGRLIWTQRRLFSSEQPESHIVKWVQQILRSGDVFFDVGAHYGWISIAAARCVGRVGRVIAFEPSPVLVDVLSYHKRMNRLKCVEVVPKAVCNFCDTAIPFFLINSGLSFRNSLTIGPDNVPYLTPGEKTKCHVPTISLDRFCMESGMVPKLIKIDVEGAEFLALQGAEYVIERFRPGLILGIHPFWLPESQTPEQIFEFVKRHKYDIRDQHVIEFNNDYLADYLCSPAQT